MWAWLEHHLGDQEPRRPSQQGASSLGGMKTLALQFQASATSSALSLPALPHPQPLAGPPWVGRAGQGSAKARQQGVIITPSRAGVRVKPAFLSGPQALR